MSAYISTSSDPSKMIYRSAPEGRHGRARHGRAGQLIHLEYLSEEAGGEKVILLKDLDTRNAAFLEFHNATECRATNRQTKSNFKK